MRLPDPLRAAAACCLCTLFSGGALHAGAYIFAESNDPDFITHPSPYTGSGGTVTVRVCIDPASANAAAMELPVQNNINIFNRLEPTTDNLLRGGNNNIPSGDIDFESVSLHEIGHCLGMAHVNAASESGLSGQDREATKAQAGVNGVLDIDDGADDVMGSSDDLRGDDVNVHWFRKSNNDPFTIDSPIDASTYSRDIADLPGGHNFAANAARKVSTELGYPKTEAVMQQGTAFDEAQRTLNHDDVATLLLAASGLDETAGTADDYTLELEYGGVSSSNCDISLSFSSTSSLAFCSVDGELISSPPPPYNHVRVVNPVIEFGDGYDWFFNDVPVNQAPDLAGIGDQSVTETQVLVLALSATDADADAISFSATGLAPFMQLVDNGDGTASLTISPLLGDAGSFPVTISATDDGLPPLTGEEMLTISIDALDSDDDGLGDFDEINTWFTDPLLADTDGDFIDDGIEVGNGSDPNDPASWPALQDGDLAPWGAPDGLLNAADLYIATRIALGQLPATSLELAHGDLYPPAAPDGFIDVSDLLLLKALLDQQ